MVRSRKFLVMALCAILLLSLVGAHANHTHESEESDKEQSVLTDGYSSFATYLGVAEIVLGVGLLSLAGIHYFRNAD